MVPKVKQVKRRREGSAIALKANDVRMSGPGVALRQLLLNTARKIAPQHSASRSCLSGKLPAAPR
jgi:hypothetical protein